MVVCSRFKYYCSVFKVFSQAIYKGQYYIIYSFLFDQQICFFSLWNIIYWIKTSQFSFLFIFDYFSETILLIVSEILANILMLDIL